MYVSAAFPLLLLKVRKFAELARVSSTPAIVLLLKSSDFYIRQITDYVRFYCTLFIYDNTCVETRSHL